MVLWVTKEFKNYRIVDFIIYDCYISQLLDIHIQIVPLKEHSTLLDELRCLNLEKNFKSNTVHSVTQQTPFNLALDHTKITLFDLLE